MKQAVARDRELRGLQQQGSDEAAIAASEQFRQKAEEAVRREAEAVQLRQELARLQAHSDQLNVQASQLPGKVRQISYEKKVTVWVHVIPAICEQHQ